jgi:hypothetical protein
MTRPSIRAKSAMGDNWSIPAVDAGRHAGEVVGPERAIAGVRPQDSHIGHSVAELKVAHAITELIDFPDDIIAQHERRPSRRGLRVEVAPDSNPSGSPKRLTCTPGCAARSWAISLQRIIPQKRRKAFSGVPLPTSSLSHRRSGGSRTDPELDHRLPAPSPRSPGAPTTASIRSVFCSKGDVLPPRGFAAELPVSRSRCIHLTAVLMATPNTSAASQRDIPDVTVAINRSRKSLE